MPSMAEERDIVAGKARRRLVQLAPFYSEERGGEPNQPCSVEVSDQVEALARQLAQHLRPTDFTELRIMDKPSWLTIDGKGEEEEALFTTLSHGRLYVFESHVRTFAIDVYGQLFLRRRYKELIGAALAFCSLVPLHDSGLDKGVIEIELRATLERALAKAKSKSSSFVAD